MEMPWNQPHPPPAFDSPGPRVKRGAIIGLGNVAVNGHLPGWLERDDVDVVAVADARPARRAEAAARLPDARWYDSPQALLDQEALDFVDICTPPRSHADLVTAALRSGHHVLCEKPLVCSPGELAAVARAATASGRVLHTVHNWHNAPILRRAAGLLAAGIVGRVEHVTWETLRTKPAAAADGAVNWRTDADVAGGGVLSDHGWHVFYVLRRWLGAEPPTVRAVLERRRHTEWSVEDTARVHLTFPGATAEVFLTWAANTRRSSVEIRGREGVLRLEDDTVVLSPRTGPERRWPCPPALSAGSAHPDWFGPVADRFLADVDAGAPAGENLAEAVHCVLVEAAARASSRRGEEVAFPRAAEWDRW
jgi:predicted dehydrogenase